MKAVGLTLALLAASCQRSPPAQLAPAASALRPPEARDASGGPATGRSASAPTAPGSASSLPSERRERLRSRLLLTQGRFEGAAGLTALGAKVRGVEVGSTGDRATLRFRYEGPSAQRTALGSGAVREQLGVKLRARDTCNLVYVMWRLSPEAKLVVSVKVNPDDTSHDECENRGYTNLRPLAEGAIPTLAAGQEHELAAEISGEDLEARIDGRVVWRGRLPADAAKLTGPAGFRSDNIRWTLVDFDGTERK